jgi:hypothetical protein
MMTNIQSFEDQLRAAPTKEAFLATCRSLETPDVMIDREALSLYAANLYKPKVIGDWKDYLTPDNKNLLIDFVELAVSTVQQGGYLYTGQDGTIQKWEIDGSGAKALLSKMDEVRNAKALPYIDLQDAIAVRATLRDTFNGTPYGRERLELWAELGRAAYPDTLKEIFADSVSAASAAGKNTRYHFDFNSLKKLAEYFPKGLGEDPFMKKAALLPILFAGVAHNKQAPDSVSLDIIAPADYRAPQTLHNIGILRYSDRLVEALESKALLDEGDSFVTQIRAQNVIAVEEILSARPDLQMHHIDGELWFAGRLFDVPTESLDEKKQKMKSGLEKPRTQSSFAQPGFGRTTGQPMNVATLRF